MQRPAIWLLTTVLAGCASQPTSFVAPTVAGMPASEVSKVIAASEAGLFPCSIVHIMNVRGSEVLNLGGSLKSDVTLPPGSYRITLRCASVQHRFEPQADVIVQAGKTYRVTGYLVDDSFTIFTMKMRAKVAEVL